MCPGGGDPVPRVCGRSPDLSCLYENRSEPVINKYESFSEHGVSILQLRRGSILLPGPREELAYRERYYDELNVGLSHVARFVLARPRMTVRSLVANPGGIPQGFHRWVFDRRAASTRRRHEKEGLIVPPLLFLSVTAKCNLACRGCFMRDRRTAHEPELSAGEIASIVAQAAELGVTYIILLGGEPLLRWKELFPIARSNPAMVFPLFSNGMLIDETIAADLARTFNVIPFVSLDGSRSGTDARRGDGVYDRIVDVCRLLDRTIPVFGVSVTVTTENLDLVQSEPFIRNLLSTGASAVAFLMWVPTDPGTGHLVLNREQRHNLRLTVGELNRRLPALFMVAPGGAGRFGGCLVAGRGFAAINPWGRLEPCMMAPVPVANLKVEPLKDALASPIFRVIRDNAIF